MTFASELAAIEYDIGQGDDNIDLAAKRLYDVTLCYDQMDEETFIELVNKIYLQGGRDNPEDLWGKYY